jgi:hypothetical protein
VNLLLSQQRMDDASSSRNLLGLTPQWPGRGLIQRLESFNAKQKACPNRSFKPKSICSNWESRQPVNMQASLNLAMGYMQANQTNRSYAVPDQMLASSISTPAWCSP